MSRHSWARFLVQRLTAACLPLLVVSGAAAQTTVTAISGDTVTLSAGASDGVRAGMTGRVTRQEMVGGSLQTFEIATFEVMSVEARACRARLTAVGEGWTVAQGMDAVFDRELRPPRPDTTTIVIRSNVSGDVVFVDGRRLGPTPRTVEVAPGEHVVRVEKQGYEPAERRVTVAVGQQAVVRAELTPAPTPTPAPRDPFELQRRAGAAFDAGRWQEAAAGYEAVLRLVPGDPLATARLAEARRRLRAEEQAAVEARRRAEEDAARREEVRRKLANADYLMRMGDEMGGQGDWALAAEYYGQVADVDPSYMESGARRSLALVRAALAAGDMAAAVREHRGLEGMSLPAGLRAEAEALSERLVRLPEGFAEVAAGDAEWRGISAAQRRAADARGWPALVRETRTGGRWAWIPAGAFEMGCVPGDSRCYGNEEPRHRVEITEGLWMTTTEVTVGQYRAFTRATGRSAPAQPSFTQGDDHPVVNVSWHDAVAYCSWAGGRLPSEAEWEHAARGGREGARYPWGDEITHERANYGKDRCCGGLARGRDRWEHTSPVGSFEANGFGLYDMAGNVWEWVADWYDDGYYRGSSSADPKGPSSGSSRVLRGGGWYFNPRRLRTSYRYRFDPAGHYVSGGLRCVRDGGIP